MEEVAKSIQRAMNARGFHAAAEDFMERAKYSYSERELTRIARFWN